MVRPRQNKKGIMLFIVLATLLIVLIIVNGILGFVLSHFRHTYHQANRIRAYYAAFAGVNWAIENLRTGTRGSGDYTIGCSASYTLNDCDIPFRVDVNITDPVSGIRNIIATVTYTYTP